MKLLQEYFSYWIILNSVIIEIETKAMIPLSSDSIEEYPTMSCIVELTKNFINCGALLTLVDNTDRIDPLIKSISATDCYTFILRSIHNNWRLLPTEVYIIYSLNVAQFKSSLNDLTKEVGWNPRAKFFLTTEELKNEEIIEIFEILLTHNIFDVLFVIEGKSGTAIVYSYFPFDNQKCGQVSEDLIKKEDCRFVQTIERNSDTLEDKYQNCTIVVAASEDVINFIYESNTEFSYLGIKAGLEQHLLKNIAKLENLRIEYILAGPELRYGVVLPNHTTTGVLGYLQNNTVSIVGGGFFLIRNRAEVFDFIWGYNYEDLLLLTPAYGIKYWENIYHEFSGSTWMLIIVSFLSTSTVIGIIRKYSLGKEDDKILLLIKMWGYMYGHPDFGWFQVKKMRIYLIFWILFTFFISSFYNTAYYSLLTSQHEEKLRQKPKNLESLPFMPCLNDAIRTFFKFNFNETLPGNRKGSCRYTKMALDVVAKTVKYYTIDLSISYKLREYRYIDKDGNHKLQKSKYSSDLIVSMYTKRGFPLLQKFLRYAAYHFESGIFQKHLEEMYHNNRIFQKHHHSQYRNARLSDFMVVFYVLFFGYFISLVCFIIEINK